MRKMLLAAIILLHTIVVCSQVPITDNRTDSTVTEIKPNDVTNEFDVIASPNSSTNNFTITVKGNANEKMTIQIIDMYGRIIETRKVTANSIIRFGDRYKRGTYFMRIMPEKEFNTKTFGKGTTKKIINH